MDGKRAYHLLEKLCFTRVGGSKEELKAANIILDEIKEAGGNGEIVPFEVNAFNVKKATLTTSNGKEYEVSGWSYTGNTPEEGITADFYYMETYGEVDKVNAKGKIVLVNGMPYQEDYKAVLASGALAFISFNGDVADDHCDLNYNEVEDLFFPGKPIPAVNMRVRDAIELVREYPEKVTLTLLQEELKETSHNVIAEIKGTMYPEEVIVYTAHYDSVLYSKGVYDNGAGSVTIMEMYRHYLANPPKRTVRFIWCGSEERGLLGSFAYVKNNEEELKNIKFILNADVGACVLGVDNIIVTGHESIVHAIDFITKEKGISACVKQGIYSSDHIPFVDKGIPAINFVRNGARGASHIHDRHDTMFFLSADALQKTIDLVELLSNMFVNAVALPFNSEIPENVKKDINKYLGKEEKKS